MFISIIFVISMSIVISQPSLILIVLFIHIYYYYKNRNLSWVLTIVILILFYFRLGFIVPTPNLNSSFTVVYQKNTYTIFRQNLNHYSSFTDVELLRGDIVKINGEFNFKKDDSFFDLMRMNHQYQGLQIKNITKINESKLIKNVSYILDNNPLFKRILFFESVQIDSDFVSLLISSGLLISTFFYQVRKWCQLFFKRQITTLIIVFLNILSVILLGFRFVLFRLLIKELCFILVKNYRSRLFIEISIVLFFYPFALGQFAFLFPYSIKLTRFFSHDNKHLRIKQTLILMIIQLVTLFKFNLIQSVFFQIYRSLSTILLYLAILSIFIRQLSLERILELVNTDIFQVNLVGQMPLALGLLILSVIVFEEKLIRIGLITALSMFIFFLLNEFHPYYQVIFFDVNQGDSTLLISPFHKELILIDTGKKSHYEQLKKGLYSVGVKKIDTLIITHQDADHSDNKEDLILDFNIKQIIESKADNLVTQDFMVEQFLKDNRFDNENDNSLVFKFLIEDKSFLFLGDISKDIERILLSRYPQLKASVLKLAHHGSNTSSDEVFISILNPQYSIISSDPTAYGHPHFEVLQNLSKYKIKTFLTYRDSHIRFIMHPMKTFIITSNRIYISDGIIDP